jgi:molecular chaperone DnaJ
VRFGFTLNNPDEVLPVSAEFYLFDNIVNAGFNLAGDLFVEILVTPHPIFQREDLDVTLDVPIEMFEAALGAEVTVPTVYGDKVTVVVPAGSKSGQVLRVSKRGIKTEQETGDMFIRLMIDVPEKLNPIQKQALKDLQAATKRDTRKNLFT